MANERAVSQRRVLKGAAQAGALTAAPLVVSASALGKGGAVAPSDRINLAGLGIGNRGAYVLEGFLLQKDVPFRAICDVQSQRREAIKSRAVGDHDLAAVGSLHPAVIPLPTDMAASQAHEAAVPEEGLRPWPTHFQRG